MAENQNKQTQDSNTGSQRQTNVGGSPGAQPQEQHGHGNRQDQGDPTEGRDRAPSNRDRDPNDPWLGGG